MTHEGGGRAEWDDASEAHDFALFVEKVRKFREEERDRTRTSSHFTSPHVRGIEQFDPSELERRDREIYDKIELKTVTNDEWDAYDRKLKAEEAQGGISKSRWIFLMFLRNEINTLFYQRSRDARIAREKKQAP